MADASKFTIGSFWYISNGHFNSGAKVSVLTLTLKVHDNMRPLLWVALALTAVVTPKGNDDFVGGIEVTAKPGGEAILNSTTGLSEVTSLGHTITGVLKLIALLSPIS